MEKLEKLNNPEPNPSIKEIVNCVRPLIAISLDMGCTSKFDISSFISTKPAVDCDENHVDDLKKELLMEFPGLEVDRNTLLILIHAYSSIHNLFSSFQKASLKPEKNLSSFSLVSSGERFDVSMDDINSLFIPDSDILLCDSGLEKEIQIQLSPYAKLSFLNNIYSHYFSSDEMKILKKLAVIKQPDVSSDSFYTPIDTTIIYKYLNLLQSKDSSVILSNLFEKVATFHHHVIDSFKPDGTDLFTNMSDGFVTDLELLISS